MRKTSRGYHLLTFQVESLIKKVLFLNKFNFETLIHQFLSIFLKYSTDLVMVRPEIRHILVRYFNHKTRWPNRSSLFLIQYTRWKMKFTIFLPLGSKKAGRFEKLLGFARSHSIVTIGSVSLSCATTLHPSCLPNSNGIFLWDFLQSYNFSPCLSVKKFKSIYTPKNPDNESRRCFPFVMSAIVMVIFLFNIIAFFSLIFYSFFIKFRTFFTSWPI